MCLVSKETSQKEKPLPLKLPDNTRRRGGKPQRQALADSHTVAGQDRDPRVGQMSFVLLGLKPKIIFFFCNKDDHTCASPSHQVCEFLSN